MRLHLEHSLTQVLIPEMAASNRVLVLLCLFSEVDPFEVFEIYIVNIGLNFHVTLIIVHDDLGGRIFELYYLLNKQVFN